MFPRSGSIESVGSSASSCARRRAEAVPMRMPARRDVDPHSASRGPPPRVGADRQARRVARRHVLGRVDGNVDPVVEQRLFELLHEYASRADLAERPGPITVTGGGDRYQRDLDPAGAAPSRRAQPGSARAYCRASRREAAQRRLGAVCDSPHASRVDGLMRTKAVGSERQRPPDADRAGHVCSSSPGRTGGARRQHRPRRPTSRQPLSSRTVGRWRSLLTICAVIASTARRSLSGSLPSRPSARASSAARISSACARATRSPARRRAMPATRGTARPRRRRALGAHRFGAPIAQ